MCLDEVTGKPEKKDGVGYKEFTGDEYHHLSFLIFSPKGEGARVKYNHWYKDNNTKDLGIGYNKPSYPAGFHIYQEKPKYNNVRRVSYKGAHTIGEQDGRVVIVAKEIFIHKKNIQ